MKRHPTRALLIFLALASILAAVSCAGSTPDPLAAGPEASGGSATLAIGQALEISLEGNHTTGYAWAVKKSGEPVLSQQGEPEYVEGDTTGTVVGSGGTYTFTFEGAETGTATLELAYARSWEDTEPLDTFTLEVTVE
jgi:inhibitor of cysteine peptidase